MDARLNVQIETSRGSHARDLRGKRSSAIVWPDDDHDGRQSLPVIQAPKTEAGQPR